MFETMTDDAWDDFISDWHRREKKILYPPAQTAFRAGVAVALLIEAKIREVLGVIPSR